MHNKLGLDNLGLTSASHPFLYMWLRSDGCSPFPLGIDITFLELSLWVVIVTALFQLLVKFQFGQQEMKF